MQVRSALPSPIRWWLTVRFLSLIHILTIDQRTAELNNISVGSDVTLGVTLPLGSRYYDVEMEAKVTGLMNFPETTVSASSVAVYISEAKFEEMAKEKYPYINIDVSYFYNQVVIKTSEADALKTEINRCV